MRLLVGILVLTIPFSILSQEYAEFSTDTTRFRTYYTKDGKQLPDHISQQVWYINGQKMHYGSGSVQVKVNPNKLDTILFQGYRRNSFDTIICNVSEPNKYRFFYNPCCGRFNIQNESSKKFIPGNVLFNLKHKSTNTYLGTLGETGRLIGHQNKDTLHVDCRSAMSPNVYKITFKQIDICENDSDCEEGTCLQNEGETNWDFGFNTVSKKLDIIFMPLKSEPIEIVYDQKKDKIEIR